MRPRKKRLTKNDYCDAQIHWISDVSIQTSNDQLPRWIYRRERAASAPGKLPNAAQKKCDPKSDAKEAAEILPTPKIKVQPIQAEKRPWHIAGDEPGKQNCPQNTSKSQKSGTPEGAIGIPMKAHSLTRTRSATAGYRGKHAEVASKWGQPARESFRSSIAKVDHPKLSTVVVRRLAFNSRYTREYFRSWSDLLDHCFLTSL
jgi:hypothetical protein